MTATARELLDTLLDRHERQPDRIRRVMEKAPLGFVSAAAQSEFESVISGAVSAGAVQIERGRGDIRHLICRVILKDPAKLYAFLERTPRSQRAAAAASRLQAGICPKAEFVRATADHIREAWLAGKDRPLGLCVDEPGEAIRFLRVFDAALAKPMEDRTDLRTWSRRSTGDSKAIEAQAARIASAMRRLGAVEPHLDEVEVLVQMGLEKYPSRSWWLGPFWPTASMSRAWSIAACRPRRPTD
jgi:hypothetical protein